ncbi:hypothetical protein ACFLTZ_01600 [Chloroflexota bacterium]
MRHIGHWYVQREFQVSLVLRQYQFGDTLDSQLAHPAYVVWPLALRLALESVLVLETVLALETVPALELVLALSHHRLKAKPIWRLLLLLKASIHL